MYQTLPEYLDHWAGKCPDEIWLRERRGDAVREWNWAETQREVRALAARYVMFRITGAPYFAFLFTGRRAITPSCE